MRLLLAAVACVLAGCLNGGAPPDVPPYVVVKEDPTDVPLHGATAADVERFLEGDALFDKPFRPAEGLGPVYIRAACSACHADAARGPGRVQKMVRVEADGVTPAADQRLLDVTVRPYAVGDATPLLPPDDADVRLTQRLPPAVFGRGYMEAVLDSEIERVAAEQLARDDSITGRVQRMNPEGTQAADGGLIGRFGLRATVPDLEQFAARALQLDLGVTSPLRPTELPNPDGAVDDDKPGVDVEIGTVALLADYVRFLEIPERAPGHARGRALFEEVRCAVCHVPALRTRADYPIAVLADVDAPVYTDFLLHDRGPGSDDSVEEGAASSSEWRTAPLIGLRFMTAYLHDGSAQTVEEAIAAHGNPGAESAAAADLFDALEPDDKAALLAFVKSL